MKKGIYNNVVINFMEKAYAVILASIYFIILNIPIAMLIILMALNSEAKSGLILTYICLLPIAPALSAVYSIVIKIQSGEKVDKLTKTFIKSYKNNFKQSFLWGTVMNLILMVLYVDIKYIDIDIKGVFYVLMAYAIVTFNYGIVYISKFYLKFKDIVKLSYLSTFKYLITSLAILSVCVLGAMVIVYLGYFGIIIFAPAFTWAVLVMCKKPLEEVREIIIVE